MVKIAIITSFLTLSLFANLKNDCLNCHEKEKIPNEVIYKRYLLEYSTSKNIQKAMFNYLKNPTKNSSIMPPQFFIRFPMKQKSKLDDDRLKHNIKLYIQKFDIKKRLFIKE